MLINPFFDKFRAKVNECAPQKRAAECLPPVKYWVSRHCSAIITAVGTLRSRSATSCAVVPGVSLGMLSTRPSRPTKVEEPADGEGSLEESGSPATNGPMIKADKEAMQTAVKNLVENAIHYSPEHTTVAVGVGERDGKVTIRVVDQGIGIPAKSLDRIFERFYRVYPARSRETGGSGLGLAITKHCVQENGGRISVWSRTGEGSTFTIELPAAPDEDDDEARSDESTQA